MLSWKEGAINLKMAKPGAVHGQKGGTVVSKSVPKLKESVPPPPHPGKGVGGAFCKALHIWKQAKISLKVIQILSDLSIFVNNKHFYENFFLINTKIRNTEEAV